jgi:putative addiction module component (TIGR02574 family)
MSTLVNKLYEDAMRLPDDERAALATWLMDSLDQGVDEEAQAAWDNEIQRRVAELEAGTAKTVPWSVVRRTILGLPDEQPKA